MRFHLHPGQFRAWQSEKRFVLILAGAQSGKTALGPVWLFREIQRRGPGDYMVVSPSYPLLSKKALPEFLKLFSRQLRLGKYHAQAKVFTFSEDGQKRIHGAAHPDTPTQVFFCHAQDPESLESATAKAAWLDEAGQKKFRLGSWQAILRRLAINQGRVLLTTTPYDLGWLAQKLYAPWKEAQDRGATHPDIDVVNFTSIENPSFGKEEYERARRDLPGWLFDLMYRGILTRPAGMIYGSFDPLRHTCPRFTLPRDWPRYLGLDFGGVNMAATFWAEELAPRSRLPTGKLYLYRTYHTGNRTVEEHVAAILADEPGLPLAVGGSASEDRWRDEFAAAGLPVREPAIAGPDSVEVGITRVYGAHARGEIVVFNDLAEYLDEKLSYSREMNESGEPTAKIADKDTFHLMDSERYIIGWVRSGAGVIDPTPDPRARSVLADMPAGIFLNEKAE